MAWPSRSVSLPRSLGRRGPLLPLSGSGTTIAMLEPSVAICWFTETFAPLPTATANITENTPIITPNVVRIDRMRFVRSAVMAMATFTPQAAIELSRPLMPVPPGGAILQGRLR